MRIAGKTLVVILPIVCLAMSGVSARAEPPGAPAHSEHPSDVALIEDSGHWVYRHFPTNLRLYVFDGDAPGKSACDANCAGAWPPLRPHANAVPVGDWTIITRADGAQQWAYKNQPVYVRYHDSPSEPSGDGVDGKWHFLVP